MAVCDVSLSSNLKLVRVIEMKCGKISIRGCLMVACMWIGGSFSIDAQMVDLGDFLILDRYETWSMEGNASFVYSGMPLSAEVGVSIENFAGPVLHGVQTTRMVIQGSGDAGNPLLPLLFSVVQTLRLRMDDDGLYIHARDGAIYLNGTLMDWEQEVYVSPAMLLPRMIEIGESYPFVSKLTTGDVQNVVVVESIESVETALGIVEAIKLVLFSDGDTPFALWLVRTVGPVKTQIDSTLGGEPLGLYGILTDTTRPVHVQPVKTFWSGTFNMGEGWRSAKSLGSFWVPDSDSPWMGHHGFGWAYCDGELTNLWIYLPGAGWFWTSTDFYPFMYSDTHGEVLYYFDLPGSKMFWSFLLNDYLSVGPGG